MRRAPIVTVVATLALASVAACGSTPTRPTRPTPAAAPALGHGWHDDVLAIAAGADHEARRRVIEARLDALGIPFERMAFAAPAREGTNLVATLPGDPKLPLLLVGAHYDRVDVGLGAVDNGGGCATVLALGEALAREPLGHHRVALAFWDLEEAGLLGSKAFVAARGASVELYLNFDVFGYGDTIWAMEPAPSPLGDALAAAGAEAGVAVARGRDYPPTDHLAFLEGGRPAASLSLVGGAEIPHILDGFAGRPMQVVPRVLTLIHSPHDVPAALDPPAVRTALPVVLGALRAWDARAHPSI